VDQIGRYRVLGELGRGASGVVYRAQDPAIGRVIAIKTIRLSDVTDDAERARLRERLFREAQSAGMLSHPNIVTIYDIAEENGLAYIFMECVDGPPLEKVLNSPEPLRGDRVLNILRQTAVALDYAHQKGIVHRDIKPANILIDEQSHAKIADFGVAKIVSQQMTQSGVMTGTPNYMSPEQVQGHAVDGRADQFSLAVIAYEILTGEKPFLADQLPALLFRIVREDPVPPQRLNPTVGPQVEAVFRKALAKSANDRYGSCTEFVDGLAAALKSSPSWHPIPRSSAQNMPTLVAPAIEVSRAAPPKLVPPMNVPLPVESGVSDYVHLRHDQTQETESRNPLLKSLVWMLVGIGLVGLVLFGAQKYVFNHSAEAPPADAGVQTPGEQPSTPAASDDTAPKPSPVGQATAPDQPGPTAAAAQSPDNTAPESKPAPKNSDADSTPPAATPPGPHDATQHERPAAASATNSAVPGASPKSTFQPSVQFVTEPPGAQVVVDGDSSQTCRTPCMMPLPSGRHALNVQIAGYRPYPRVFNVPQDSDIFLQLTKASGTLSITSEPGGAAIDLDGMPQSKRTPALFTLPPGAYHVKVSRSGAFIEFDVQLRDGEFITKRVDF
jgi:serine/threonine-protein kinase